MKIGALIFLLTSAFALLEREKGKNDWHLENIGELSDLVVLEDNLVYTLSTDGIVTLFNVDRQTMKWKKTLPRNIGESFAMRHLGRNLLVHSNDRMMLINSAGHVIFEVPFASHKGDKVPIEIFQAENSEIYIAYAAGHAVTIYKTYQKMGTIKITEEVETLVHDEFEPLELIYSDEKLHLVAKTGASGAATILGSFIVDFEKISCDMILQQEVASFDSTARRNKLIMLYRESSDMSILDPTDLKQRLFKK